MFRIEYFAWFFFLLLASAGLIAQTKQTAAKGDDSIAAGDWTTYDRDYKGLRYSPLKEITTSNVTKLQPLCTYDSGAKTSFETGISSRQINGC